MSLKFPLVGDYSPVLIDQLAQLGLSFTWTIPKISLNPTQRNLIVLGIYTLGVFLVLAQIWQDLQEFIKLELDRPSLTEQLNQNNLQDLIGVEFKLADFYKPQKLNSWGIILSNKSNTHALYLIWELTTLTNLPTGTRRVIRLIPGMNLKLDQPQASSFIPPNQKIAETFTVESSLKPNPQGRLEVALPLFNPQQLMKATIKGDRVTLRLVLQIQDPTPGGAKIDQVLLCHFRITKPSLKRTLYWDS